MASTIKKGDTFPALFGSASTKAGLLDLTVASHLEVIIVGPVTITGVPTAKTPPVKDEEEIERNWEYPWAPGDTNTAGAYKVELKVTWSTGVVESFPNTGTEKLTIEDTVK